MSRDNLTSYRPQARNANRHTARGLGALEKSIQSDGWIGAITVAADGETFDGSARIEVSAAAGFDDALVIHSDGSRPLVHVRDDIPNADDARALTGGLGATAILVVCGIRQNRKQRVIRFIPFSLTLQSPSRPFRSLSAAPVGYTYSRVKTSGIRPLMN